MNPNDDQTRQAVAQLDELLKEFAGLRQKSQHEDISATPEDMAVRFGND